MRFFLETLMRRDQSRVAPSSNELSEEHLEGVSGGLNPQPIPPGRASSLVNNCGNATGPVTMHLNTQVCPSHIQVVSCGH